ncbi:MAG: magnesium transporter CorA family protein [Actinomycetia bacterium]|nr:magnesium transporter CorA family protein [Actinomycetes bacterium]
MKTMYLSTEDGRFSQVEEAASGAWVSLIEPTPAEIAAVAKEFHIDPDDIGAALDVEERSRVTSEDGYVLVLVDVPAMEDRGGRPWYITIPLGIIITPRAMITVCSQRTSVINDFESGRVRDFRTFMKTRFTLQLLRRNSAAYINILHDIDKLIDQGEANLRRSTRNEDLVNMFELEKSLVYINTSLVSNQRVLDRLMRTAGIKKYPEDDDLLDDTVIENEQAVEMSTIYSNILSGTMDAYASVISNNQNAIMKTLALATIVLAVPTMIFSAYGMNLNTKGYPFEAPLWGFYAVVGISFGISFLIVVYFFRKKWF